jgi:CO dehydrogenase maturation factor
MIISITGKGGVGKTSLLAILLDELAGCGYSGEVLVVDADPATTLHFALGLPEPGATVADVRDMTPLDAQTVRSLPAGRTVSSYVLGQLQGAGVISRHRLGQMAFDLMAMGQGEGPGCYCSINNALARALGQVVSSYRLILVDNEAGMEHLSRYRLPQADLLIVVVTPGRAAQAVGRRVLATARQVGMAIESTWTIFNRAPAGYRPPGEEAGETLVVPASPPLVELERQGQPVVALPADDPIRIALQPLVEGIRRCA